MESNISVMIILIWCILYNLMIPSLSKETSILLDPKSEFIDYVKPINEKVMVYTDEQLKDFKEKHKQDKLIDMTKNLVLNDENIYDKFPTGMIKFVTKPVLFTLLLQKNQISMFSIWINFELLKMSIKMIILSTLKISHNMTFLSPNLPCHW